LGESLEQPNDLSDWLQSNGIEVQQLAHVRHTDGTRRDALVVLAQCMTGDHLAMALAALAQMPGNPTPAALWRVEDVGCVDGLEP
jgi:hypothetical protein